MILKIVFSMLTLKLLILPCFVIHMDWIGALACISILIYGSSVHKTLTICIHTYVGVMNTIAVAA